MTFFISKLFSYKILLLLSVVFFVFFAMPKFADASCEVNISNLQTRFRANGVMGQEMPVNWFDDSSGEEPFVYVDIKFTGCTTSDSLYLTVFGIVNIQNFAKAVENYQIPVASYVNDGGLTVAFRAEEMGCDGDNNDAGGRQCLLFGVLTDLPTNNQNFTIKAILGNFIPYASDSVASFFLNSFFTGQVSPAGIDCLPKLGYHYLKSTIVNNEGFSCQHDYFTLNNLFPDLGQQLSINKVYNYYNTYFSFNAPIPTYSTAGWFLDSNNNNTLTFQGGGVVPPISFIALPGFSFDCDGVCGNDPWILLDNNSPFIPYGTNHPLDTGYTPVGSLPSNYEDNYFPLAPLPFEGLNGGSTPTLGSYLVGLFNAGIIITILLTVIMIVFNGIKYMTVDAIGTKTESRANIWNAIMGLVIALGSWLLLNTVSPKLASNLTINLPNVSIDGYTYTEPGKAVIGPGCGPKEPYNPPKCLSCASLLGEEFPLKQSINNQTHANIRPGMKKKLKEFKEILSSNNISWHITEAFSPTYLSHCSQCHYKGTCIDANFTGSSTSTVENVKAFIQAAKSVGLRAVYETNSEQQYNQLKAANIDISFEGKGNLLFLSEITAPHFSVYD